MRAFMASATLLALSLPGLADSTSWVGREAIARQRGVHLRDDSLRKPIAPLNEASYTVLKEKEGWIFINQQGVAGWITKQESVLVDDAVPYFTKRLQLNNRDDYAWAHRSWALCRQNQHDKGLDDINKAILLSPKMATWYLYRASIWLTKGDHAKARADSEVALQFKPKDAFAHQTRGLACRGLKDFDTAVKSFTQAIELEPKFVSAYYNRASTHVDRKDDKSAVADFTEVLRLDPNNMNAMVERGNASLRLKDFDKALADFEQAVKADPKQAVSVHNRGYVHYLKDDFDKALADFDKALELDSTYVLGYLNRANAFMKKGNIDKAIADYDDALRLEPKNGAALHNRGVAYVERGNGQLKARAFAKAAADYREALRLNPDQASASMALALLLASCPDASLRDGKQAVTLARRACELTEFKRGAYLEALAAAHAEAGQFPEALRWQKQALEDAEHVKTNGPSARARLALYEAGKPYHMK